MWFALTEDGGDDEQELEQDSHVVHAEMWILSFVVVHMAIGQSKTPIDDQVEQATRAADEQPDRDSRINRAVGQIHRPDHYHCQVHDEHYEIAASFSLWNAL